MAKLREAEMTRAEAYAASRPPWVFNNSDEVAPAIEALNARPGLPATLCAMGVTHDPIDDMTAHAADDLFALINPIRPSSDVYRALYESLILH
jgi:alcohol dehydrogenase class IV